MISRRNFLLGSAAAVGAAALPALSAAEQFGWTEFSVPICVYRELPLVIDGGFPPPSPKLLDLLERRVAAAQEAFDAAMKPVFDEMFTAADDTTRGGLAALFDDDDPDDEWN